ncbi:hypothetical protein [Evansella cellulosilytica]|uniref:LysM domain-containing protein n=1 Tax=Evansella cellulosilytica (strain ATCC 21833 / DSM 2522 / FERM P-1141 / JCM 9156 / N-4) TaxID=649639 RepID=E6TWV2_EVAC2|nr:hypothetical protein [Evansella cellulosilytica]ADU29902.1 hypothetical protein Bcell_1639 [Evansella cellulosilytica DSM 2522]
MRPIVGLIIIAVIAISAYYDWNVGTIPHAASPHNGMAEEGSHNTDIDNITEEQNEETESSQVGSISLQFQEVVVGPGQTVYGIVKELNDELIYAPNKVVEDFEALNPSVLSHEIIIGHSYRFPIYSSNTNE